MPLREYQCDSCGHRFEVIQKMSDPPLEMCPKCGNAVRKLQSAPAFHLKGSGWYVTDYAKKDSSTSKVEDESKGASKSSSEKAETKTDTAKTSGASDAAASSTSTTPSATPAKTPGKDS